MNRTYEAKMCVRKGKHRKLEALLESQRTLYNAALEERIEYYRKTGKSRSYFDQCKALTECRQQMPEIADVPVKLQRGTLGRLDEAYKAFFKRVKKGGGKAGFPRFKSRDRYSTLAWAEYSGIRYKENVVVSDVFGRIKLLSHQTPKGDIKQARIIKRTNGYYLQLVCDIGDAPDKVVAKSAVGMDAGLSNLLTLSSAEYVDPHHYYRHAQKALRRAQRKLARAQKGSNNRKRVRADVARLHNRLSCKRKTFNHTLSKNLVDKHDAIVVENLNIAGMKNKRGRLGKSFADNAIADLMAKIAYKAEGAGKHFIEVDPKYTSQTCCQCGHRQKMELRQRTYQCGECGAEIDRDHNAAINILNKGLAQHDLPESLGLSAVSMPIGGRKGLSKVAIGLPPPANACQESEMLLFSSGVTPSQ